MRDMEKVYLSREKHKELQEELEGLKTVKRKEIAEQLEYAKSLGDLSENAEYQEARTNQANVEERIMTIEDILKRAEFVSEKQRTYANVGSSVTIEDNSGSQETWQIVGREEADLTQHKISNESPLGSVLIGKKVGERVKMVSPRGEANYTVIKIA